MVLNTSLVPLVSSDSGWQRCAVTLGAKNDVEAEIAELAREGWEVEFVTAPHYGRLLLIGYFRRRCDVPQMADAGNQDDQTSITATSAT